MSKMTNPNISALFLYYGYCKSGKGITAENAMTMLPIALVVANYAGRCYASEDDFDYDTFSPYAILSPYQAAVVIMVVARQSGQVEYEETRVQLVI